MTPFVVVPLDEWEEKKRYIEKLENEIDRFRNELNILLEQLEQKGGTSFDNGS